MAVNTEIRAVERAAAAKPEVPMLECVGLTKRFGDTLAVDNLSLTLAAGQVTALLGPSGCGKSTALRLIAGFCAPDAGRVAIAGRPVYQAGRSVPPEKRQVGMVFQEGALFPHLTVAQNIAYGLPRRSDRRPRVAEALELTGLTGLDRRLPHQLSRGAAAAGSPGPGLGPPAAAAVAGRTLFQPGRRLAGTGAPGSDDHFAGAGHYRHSGYS